MNECCSGQNVDPGLYFVTTAIFQPAIRFTCYTLLFIVNLTRLVASLLTKGQDNCGIIRNCKGRIMKTVVIVGGGFAGLTLAKKLSKSPRFRVKLVASNNYHFFPPLLYQVATAFIEPSNISYPFRKMLQGKKNIRFYMGTFKGLFPKSKIIETENGTLSYDYLVFAMGTESNFFGNANVMKDALPMKTIDDALNIRNHILLKLEQAVRSKSIQDRQRLANI